MTAQDVYDSSVRDLDPSERLRLATIILAELTQSPISHPGYSDEWTEEDIRDLQTHVARRIADEYPEEDDPASPSPGRQSRGPHFQDGAQGDNLA